MRRLDLSRLDLGFPLTLHHLVEQNLNLVSHVVQFQSLHHDLFSALLQLSQPGLLLDLHVSLVGVFRAKVVVVRPDFGTLPSPRDPSDHFGVVVRVDHHLILLHLGVSHGHLRAYGRLYSCQVAFVALDSRGQGTLLPQSLHAYSGRRTALRVRVSLVSLVRFEIGVRVN